MKVFLFVIALFVTTVSFAQSPLERRISISATQVPLDKVLQAISTKGNFFFAYNSSIIKSDSLVNLTIINKPVRDVLFVLFQSNYEYKSAGNYIILRRAPVVLKLVSSKTTVDDKVFFIAGYVLDDRTGLKVKDASVYDKARLVSTMTNGSGYFKLRLKSRYSKAAITVSKLYYADTTVLIEPKYNQIINILLMPIDREEEIVTISPDPAVIAPDTIPLEIRSSIGLDIMQSNEFSKVEETSLGKFFSNSLQRVQSLNLGSFIAERPFQVSLVPGIGTHGRLSANVINSASLNIFGGYNAGVKGAEVGTFFNMNKRNVEGAQVAGLVNLTGGNVNGAEVAGLYNLVLGNVTGVQVAGITNTVLGSVRGVQVNGIYGHSGQSVKGAQISGIANFARKSVEGIQIGGIVNYTRRLKGLQIGLINISDTSSGYSIGLINVVLKGYHKLVLTTNESLQFNAAFKTGNTNLYSMLMGGANTARDKRQFAFGYGLGTERRLGNLFSVNPELACQYIYQGSWNYTNLLSKLSLDLHLNLGKHFSLFGGPALNVFYSDQVTTVPGYKTGLADSYHKFSWDRLHDVNGWIGWNAGISIF
jgi:hypothetical protein